LFLFNSGWCNRIVWAVRRYMPERYVQAPF